MIQINIHSGGALVEADWRAVNGTEWLSLKVGDHDVTLFAKTNAQRAQFRAIADAVNAARKAVRE